MLLSYLDAILLSYLESCCYVIQAVLLCYPEAVLCYLQALYLCYLEAVLLSKDNACFFLQLALQHPIYLCLVLLTDLLPYELSTAGNYSFTHSCNIPGHLILLDLITLII